MNKRKILSLECVFGFVILVISLFVLASCKQLPFNWFITARTFKKDSQYVYRKSFHRLMISYEAFYSVNLEKYVEQPELLFENTVLQFESRYPEKKAAVVNINGVCFIAHKFTIKGIKQRLFQLLLSPSNALKSWYYRSLLEKSGIDSCKPLLLVEKRLGPFCTSSFLVTNYIHGYRASEFFSTSSPFKEQWPEVIDNIQNLLKTMSLSKLQSYDFSLKDVIIKDKEPYLIDLDKLHPIVSFTKEGSQELVYNYLHVFESELLSSKSDAYDLFHKKNLASFY